MARCSTCGNSGRVLKETHKACPRCGSGRGGGGDRNCYTCQGTGYLVKHEWVPCKCGIKAKTGCMSFVVLCAAIIIAVIFGVLR